MKASRKIWSRTCTSQVHFPVNIFLIAVYYLCLRFRIAHWLFRIINITMFYVYKNVFALQNTEHGPVERGVFTHNDHIIEQIIIIIINIIIWQWKYHRNGRKAITSIRLSLKPWKPTMIKKPQLLSLFVHRTWRQLYNVCMFILIVLLIILNHIGMVEGPEIKRVDISKLW